MRSRRPPVFRFESGGPLPALAGLLFSFLAAGGVACAPRPAAVPDAPTPPDRFADLRGGASPGERFEFPESPDEPSSRGPRDGTRPPSATPPAADSSAAPAVARIEVDAPDRDRFVLRATLPVPPGFSEPVDGRAGLGVVDRWGGGDIRPAQVEVVARRPDGEPEVVEVAALVTGPGSANGTGARFAVVRTDTAEPSGEPSGSAAPRPRELFPAPGPVPGEGGIWLRTRDVHGNVYAAELAGHPDAPGFGGEVELTSGDVLRRVRVHAALAPVERSKEGDALPCLLAAHAYWTTDAAGGPIALDLRVHNGLTAGSRPRSAFETPAGIVYWDALELVIPRAWRARPLAADPALGAARGEGPNLVVPLVARPADGSLHMTGPQGQFLRRLELRPRNDADGEEPPAQVRGLGFCVEGPGLWSWWNPETAAWFPQRTLLADWSRYRRNGLRGRAALRARLAEARAALRGALRSGSGAGLIAGDRMGWAHPLGVSVQGMTGGWGIQFVEGHLTASAADVAGIEVLMLEQRMTACRQPEAQWNLAGDPVGVHEWLDAEGRVPFDFRTNGRVVPTEFALPCRGGPPASEQVREVVRRELRPTYDRGTEYRADGEIDGSPDNLHGWWPHDGQHLSRVTRLSKALVWLANDALARDELQLSAGLFHLMFHGREHVRASWSPGATLLVAERTAARFPHQGLNIGRDQAWGIDAMCAAYSVSSPAWRARHREWFGRVGRLFVDASMPNGLIQRFRIDKVLDGRYASSQAFECAFLLHAERALIESALRGVDDELVARMKEQILRGADALTSEPIFGCVPDGGGRGGRVCGPRWHFAVAPDAQYGEAPYCDEEIWGPAFLPPDGLDGGVESLYVLAVLEYAFLLTRDEDPGPTNGYLQRVLRCGSQPETWGEFTRDLAARAGRDSSDGSPIWEGLNARLRHLGVGFR